MSALWTKHAIAETDQERPLSAPHRSAEFGGAATPSHFGEKHPAILGNDHRPLQPGFWDWFLRCSSAAPADNLYQKTPLAYVILPLTASSAGAAEEQRRMTGEIDGRIVESMNRLEYRPSAGMAAVLARQRWDAARTFRKGAIEWPATGEERMHGPR
jgi:hypothetical protein